MTDSLSLPLDQLRTDGGTQPRDKLDDNAIEEYATLLREGYEDLPPVAVMYDGTDYWLYDGYHRWHAHKRAERETIVAEVSMGTRDDAVWMSCGVNAHHGLRRKQADARRAVQTALQHPRAADLLDDEIARHCGVSAQTISKWRPKVKPKKEADLATNETEEQPDLVEPTEIPEIPEIPSDLQEKGWSLEFVPEQGWLGINDEQGVGTQPYPNPTDTIQNMQEIQAGLEGLIDKTVGMDGTDTEEQKQPNTDQTTEFQGEPKTGESEPVLPEQSNEGQGNPFTDTEPSTDQRETEVGLPEAGEPMGLPEAGEPMGELIGDSKPALSETPISQQETSIQVDEVVQVALTVQIAQTMYQVATDAWADLAHTEQDVWKAVQTSPDDVFVLVEQYQESLAFRQFLVQVAQKFGVNNTWQTAD